MIFKITFFVLLGIILFTILKPSKKEKQAQAEPEKVYKMGWGIYKTALLISYCG